MGGGRCPTFLFFKSLDNNMIYSLSIDICMQTESLQKKSRMGFKIW